MPKILFTDITVRSLPLGFHLDTKLPAFGMRVGKNRRTWIVLKGKKSDKVTLGHYPDLSLADARKKALMALGTPYEPTAVPSFPEALESFLTTRGATIRPLSRYQLNRILRRYCTWTKPLDGITHEDVAKVIEGIEAKSEAAHALKDIRAFFNWCIPRYLSASPCVGINAQSYKPRERTLTDDELVRVWRKAEQIGYPYGTIVQLLILTGQREGEVAALRWEWIGDNLTIPGSVTKNGRTTSIPLGNMAQRVIATVPKFGLLLFPARGHTDKPFQGFGSRKRVLDQCGVKGFTHHDLRRTFATNMARLGVRLEVTEKLLNHVSGSLGGIVGVYQRHDFQPEMAEAISRYESHLTALFS